MPDFVNLSVMLVCRPSTECGKCDMCGNELGHLEYRIGVNTGGGCRVVKDGQLICEHCACESHIPIMADMSCKLPDLQTYKSNPKWN